MRLPTGPPPRALLAAAAAGVVVGLVMLFVGAARSGVTTDEPLHVKRLESYYATGLYLLPKEQAKAEPGTIADSAYVYGPATALVMHQANVWAGNEIAADPTDEVQDPDVVSRRANAYVVRHLAVATIAVFAFAAIFGLGWLILGGWRWGLVAAAILAAIPAWTGSAMFNMKDTPVGTGYTVMTFALVALVLAAQRQGRRRLVLLATGALSMIPGIAIMMGTRPGMWPAVAAGITAMLVILAIGRALHWHVGAAIAVGLAGAYAVLDRIYPAVFDNPGRMITTSASASAEFPHSTPPGRGYVFGHTLVEWPVLLLLFLLVGTVVAVAVCLTLRKHDPHRSAALAVVGAQAFALPFAAVITDANLYHGLRQLLFAFPGQAILATIGVAWVVERARATPDRRGVALMVAGVSIAAIALPLAVQARMFPYQYAYGNVVAEVAGVHISNDYFRSSFREYVDDVPGTMGTRCLHWPASHITYKPSKDCRNTYGSMKPFWLERWKHARYDPASTTFYVVLRYEAGVPHNCHVFKEVTRMRNVHRVVMSRLARCTYQPAT